VKTLGRLPSALAVVLLALVTYPGADLVAWATRIAHPVTASGAAPAGSLPWLHVEHPAG